jgi:hypothetical protein
MLPKCWLRLRCMRAYALASSPVDVRGAGEIERAVTPFARGSNGGVIVTGSAMAVIHRQTITALAARHRLPAVYSDRGSVIAGGLISYGPDRIDQFRRAAGSRYFLFANNISVLGEIRRGRFLPGAAFGAAGSGLASPAETLEKTL